MVQHRIKIDLGFYRYIRDKLKLTNDWAAVKIFQDEMVEHSLVNEADVGPEITLSTPAIVRLLHHSVSKNTWDVALKHYNDLLQRKYLLNEGYYRGLLSSAVQAKQRNFTARVIETQLGLIKEGFVPDVEASRKSCYNIGFAALLRIPAPVDIVRLGRQYMKEFKSAFLNFDHSVQFLLTSKFEKHWRMAQQLIDARLEIEPDYVPPAQAFSLHKPYKQSAHQALQYFKYCKEKKLDIEPEAYSHIFAALVEKDDKASIFEALEQYLEGDEYSISICNQILQYLVEIQDVNSFLNVVKVMESLKIELDVEARSILLFGYAIVVKDMETAMIIADAIDSKSGLLPEHYLILINGFANVGQGGQMMNQLDAAINRGYINTELFEQVMIKACDLKEYKSVLTAFETMKSYNGTLI
jgi:hypothetical protein